ncbi:SDR family NAD(P)-dependent oxidoreductase [Plantactinospora endophytica]|nr:SDR family NAD(P)-dependent oxidoreductase [Plantactinospora endophytica]
MGSLTGRVALITGAGRGIGRQEALLFAAEGALVVVNDPGVALDGTGDDESVAAAVVAEITAHGGQAVANTDSVSDWDGARRMVDTAVDTFGDLHIVVNNAAIERNRAVYFMTDEDFDVVADVKLKGTFNVTAAAARHWRSRYQAGDRTDRAVVNTASGSGLLNPLPGQSNYAAANAGVAAMTVVHALELGRLGVRANCLAPSMIRTRMTLPVPGMQDVPPAGDYDPRSPAVIAPVAAYLASAGCPLTGQVLSVRGGSVIINKGWSQGPRVDKDDALWTVEELAARIAELPRDDPFDVLAEALGGAVGAADHAKMAAMIEAGLEESEQYRNMVDDRVADTSAH